MTKFNASLRGPKKHDLLTRKKRREIHIQNCDGDLKEIEMKVKKRGPLIEERREERAI